MAAVLLLAATLLGCPAPDPPGALSVPEQSLFVPEQSDWVDHGLIFGPGELGDWDVLQWGGFGGSAVKKDAVYYLYYQGARGYRPREDPGVAWRAIGVATSPDGINFEKHSANPVLEWFPNDGQEEGAVSVAALLSDQGEIVLYYGANSEAGSALYVHSDARLATSKDGFEFQDQGAVLRYANDDLWGAGDEISPIIAVQDGERWVVYYIPNGVKQSRRLGVAWGDRRDDLPHSAAARSGWFGGTSVWGMGGAARIAPGTFALFLNDVTRRSLEVRTVSLEAPRTLSPALRSYRFEEVSQATVLLDRETRTWFMYYRARDGWGVKLAPLGEPDASPPTAPPKLQGVARSGGDIDLSWGAATDVETGIASYRIFRDGAAIASVKGRSFTDRELGEESEYTYRASAVSYHGVEGPKSDPLTLRTLADESAPGIVSVNASGSPTRVTVAFSELLERSGAVDPHSYSISPGVRIHMAELQADTRSVVLTTSELADGERYVIAVRGLRDRARNPNPILAPRERTFVHSVTPGLVGAWMFDEGEGGRSADLASYGSHVELVKRPEPGPRWVPGREGGALEFDGVDDHVKIEPIGPLANATAGSHSIAARVQPDATHRSLAAPPPYQSLVTRGGSGLFYWPDGSFRARVRLADGEAVTLGSGPVDPGPWHDVLMVVDDDRKVLRLFVDAREVEDSPRSYTGRLRDHGNDPYYLGTSNPIPNLSDFRFRGSIDEVRIHDRAISAGLP